MLNTYGGGEGDTQCHNTDNQPSLANKVRIIVGKVVCTKKEFILSCKKNVQDIVVIGLVGKVVAAGVKLPSND